MTSTPTDRQRRVTIKDVAARAGVAPSVVSFVTNDRKWVAPETRERVRRAIAELGYRPSRLARGLRQQRSGVVAIVVPHVGNPFFGMLAEAAEQTLARRGLLALTASVGAGTDPAHQHAYFALLEDAHVDGLLVFPTRASLPWLQGLARSLPIVLMERELPELTAVLPLDAVVIDNAEGTRLAVQHLLSLGHRRLALVSLDVDSPSGALRAEGFRTGLRESGVPVESALVFTGPGREEDGFELTRRVLAAQPPPTALIVGTNMQTVGAVHALVAAGLAVPRDLSVVGFGPGLSTLPALDLTVVEHPAVEVGQQAAELLVHRLAGEAADVPPRRVVLHTRLRVGSSTGPPPRPAA